MHQDDERRAPQWVEGTEQAVQDLARRKEEDAQYLRGKRATNEAIRTLDSILAELKSFRGKEDINQDNAQLRRRVIAVKEEAVRVQVTGTNSKSKTEADIKGRGQCSGPEHHGKGKPWKDQKEKDVQRQATKQAVLVLAQIAQGLKSLAEDNDIKWSHPKLRPLWIEVAKLFRLLDQVLAVPVYGYHSTGPEAANLLFDHERFVGDIWEPCVGDGGLARVAEARGHTVHASDLRDHDDIYGERGVDVFDLKGVDNAVTNPPFWHALAIAEHLIRIASGKVAILLRVEFMGSMARKPFFRDHPPARVYLLPKPPKFYIGGDRNHKQANMWDFAWYVWENGFQGKTELIFPRPLAR